MRATSSSPAHRPPLPHNPQPKMRAIRPARTLCQKWHGQAEHIPSLSIRKRPNLGALLFPMEGLLGLPEGSRAKRSPGAGPLPVFRVSATHPNPAWHPKPSSRWPPIPPTLHRTLPRASPEPPRSTSVAHTEVLRGGSGEATVWLRWYERAVGYATPPITPKTARNPSLARKCCNRRKLPDQPRAHMGTTPGCHRHNTIGAGRTQSRPPRVDAAEVHQLQ